MSGVIGGVGGRQDQSVYTSTEETWTVRHTDPLVSHVSRPDPLRGVSIDTTTPVE